MDIDTSRITLWARRSLMTVSAPLLVLLTVAAGSPVEGAQECTLTFEPATVTAGGEVTTVIYTASEPVEGVSAVAFAEDSGLAGTLGEEPMQLEIDPAGAAPGEWDVTLRAGMDDLCTGPLTVSGGV